MDHVPPNKRSQIMAAVKSRDTGPEVAIRRALHRRGYRYALHSVDLPGKPDLVFRSRRKVVFVHGCFWHGHRCKKGHLPKSKVTFWATKVAANKARDRKVAVSLRRQGWSVLTVWQCKITEMDKLVDIIARFLESR
ncbi:MAG: very short patch repair endonuclease [Aestuariivirga sp.]